MPLRAWECFAAFSALRAQKKPLPAKDRGADDKGSEGRRAQKSLPRIAGDIAFTRRNKGNRLKCGAGRTLPGNEPEGRVTKKGYNRICFRVHLYALICSCNLLKSKTGRRMTAPFHAVDRGSNPLGDAKIRYNKGYQCAKHIGILSFFVSTGFPVVHVCPVASNSCRGISEGRSMLCKSVIPSRITGLYCCIFCPERYRNIQHKPGSTPCLLPTFVSAV